MPIYEYRCRSCGQTMEAIQKMGASPLRKCRNCSGKLDKLVSRTSFALKGGGWYSEGYNKSGKISGAGGDSTPKAASSSAA
jgi:putative FmdB family regulatory protein